jgi:GNAT superfamily N-acetyltransferase
VADISAAYEVVRVSFPEFVTTRAGFLHRQRSMPPEARFRSWVAEDSGRVVGFARAFHRYEQSGGSAHASASVLPERRRQGIGDALLDRALEHVADAPRVFALVAEDGRAFAEHRGYRHAQTMRISKVDPLEVDTSELARTDVSLVPVSELGPEQEFAVEAVTALDVPADEAPDRLELEQWIRDVWENPDFDWTSSFAAVVDGRAVAVSRTAVDVESGRAVNAFTGTLPEHRGRGLARLVKLAVIRRLAEQGITHLVTDNDETNARMLAVNARLGYRPHAAHFVYLLERSGNGLRESAGRT